MDQALTMSSESRRARLKDILKAAIWEKIQDRARAGLIDFAVFVDYSQKRWYLAPHLKQIAGVLQRVEQGELKRVIITMPPRHWKSSLASEKFPAWYLGKHPRDSIILASYAVSLAERFSNSVINTIKSERYKSLYTNDNGSYRECFVSDFVRDRQDDWLLRGGNRSSFRAVGVGGGITGHGANLIIIDDPIADAEAASSALQREKLWDWYRQVLRTRLEPHGAIVLIQTRWHEDDLAGRLIAEQNERGGETWYVLNLPALSQTNVPLWSDRFDEAELAAIRASVGEYAWQALYQGQPSKIEGNLIKREWFEYVPRLPFGAQWKVRAWDIAFTEKQTEKHDPDFTASVCGSIHNDILYLGLPLLFRAGVDELPKRIVAQKMQEPAMRYGMGRVAIKSALVQALNRAGVPITEYEESGDKIARASAWINRASIGRVKLVGDEKEWEAFMAQFVAFPHGAHDDAVDCVSGVGNMFGQVFSPNKVRVVTAESPYDFALSE